MVEAPRHLNFVSANFYCLIRFFLGYFARCEILCRNSELKPVVDFPPQPFYIHAWLAGTVGAKPSVFIVPFFGVPFPEELV